MRNLKCKIRPGTQANIMRPCIEVETKSCDKADEPISLFVHMLRLKENSTKDVEEYNKRLLENLIRRNQIPKTSITWHGEKIAKIYGFKIDNNGKIEYNTESKSPPKKAAPVHSVHAISAPEVDLSMFKDAILRSKQMAI